MANSSQLVTVFGYAATNVYVWVLASLGAAWLSWRLWRFTLYPMLWPDEPRTLPYFFPVIGHTWKFLSHAEGVLEDANKYFPRGEPYALSLGGSRALIVRDIDMVDRVWKDSIALTFDPFIEKTMQVFGVSAFCRQRMFQKDPAQFVPEDCKSTSLLCVANPAKRCYSDCMREWLKTQLLPGEQLDGLRITYESFIRDSLRPENLSPEFILSRNEKSVTVSLRQFSRTILTDGAMRAFFGKELFEVAPEFVPNYKLYEDDSWKLFFQYPEFMSRKMHKAKNTALDGFVRYFALPRDQTPGMAWVMHNMNAEFRNLVVAPRDRAGFIFPITWAVNNNAHQMCFWLISHLLCDLKLYEAVREERLRGCNPDGSVDIKILTTQCPTLDSVWYEVLRLYNAASTAREAQVETTIGGKRVHKRDRILTPFRQFQLDPVLFGSDARAFAPERFLKNKNPHGSKGYHPFGGGTMYCPGRFFAQQEIYMLVALFLYRYDVALVGPSILPRLDVYTPVPASMRPIDDLQIKLTPRSQSVA